jgi:hypothetical protein
MTELLSGLVNWSNTNQGFLVACLTFVYVVATLWLVWLARRQLGQTIELERARTRPVVVFDAHVERHSFVARVVNCGQTVARDVKITVKPHLQYVYGGEDSVPRDERTKPIPFVERGIPMLAPGRSIEALIGFSKRVRSAYPDMRFEGTVAYLDAQGNEYSEPFTVDLAAIQALAYRVTKDIEDVAKQLEEIARTLNHVATGFRKPLVRVISEEQHIRQEEELFRDAERSLESEPVSTARECASEPPARGDCRGDEAPGSPA